MDRLDEIMYKKNEFLEDNETLILVKDGRMISMWNDDEYLTKVSGKVDKKLQAFLDYLYDENKY